MSKVSIITPFYNGKKFIQTALESIANQTYRDFEYILVNDGSSENVSEMVKKILGKKGIYLEQKNKGQASATNLGISVSKGEYIAFCDQDDWWLPEKLEKQVAFLEENPNITMVYTDAFIADEKGILLKETWMQSRGVNHCKGFYNDCSANLFDRNFIPAPLTVMIRRFIFDKIGLFDEKFSSAYDYEYWFRILNNGFEIDYINKPLAVWRTHTLQESKNIRKAKRMQIGILKNFLKQNPQFFVKHPILVTKKFIKSYLGLILNKTGK
ncbi:MAG: putative glycosyltransferase EpsE [Syntrophomonadaceae bacterium]|nr:putative glycosyltransferase EpsE [Bacillota bacterium]